MVVKRIESQHGLSRYRIFDGERFSVESPSKTRRTANKKADNLRRKGWRVRTVRSSKSGYYLLYVRFGRKK